MSVVSGALSVALHVFLPPFLGLLAFILLLAYFGKSLGIRRLYVRVLLRVFEFARRITTEHHQKRESIFSLDESDSEGGGSDEDESEFERDVADNAVTEPAFGGSGVGDIKRKDFISALKQNKLKHGNDLRRSVISRKNNLILSPDGPTKLVEEANTMKVWSSKVMAGEVVSAATLQREFELDDILDYIKTGIASVIEDEVTQRFVAEELKSWNLLTRTIRLTVIWIIGFFFRYFILLPGRACILAVGLLWMAVCMAFVGQLPEGEFKKWLHYQVFTSCFQILGGSISAVVTYHNRQNKPKRGICVANHTSPIDVLILACDNAYALIGQHHAGLLGKFQAVLSKCSDHIWFERSESKDRALITKRLKEHVEDENKLPILIFPEGTCINNTSVMQFKKGSFEVGGTVYPVAIKYDPNFGDAFWNSSQNGMLSYIYMMMTSWAIVCDVWYLPPMQRKENEDAVTFANRVKAEIARQGGLVDLMWDGNLKRMEVKSEWKAKQQEEFSRRFKAE